MLSACPIAWACTETSEQYILAGVYFVSLWFLRYTISILHYIDFRISISNNVSSWSKSVSLYILVSGYLSWSIISVAVRFCTFLYSRRSTSQLLDVVMYSLPLACSLGTWRSVGFKGIVFVCRSTWCCLWRKVVRTRVILHNNWLFISMKPHKHWFLVCLTPHKYWFFLRLKAHKHWLFVRMKPSKDWPFVSLNPHKHWFFVCLKLYKDWIFLRLMPYKHFVRPRSLQTVVLHNSNSEATKNCSSSYL